MSESGHLELLGLSGSGHCAGSGVRALSLRNGGRDATLRRLERPPPRLLGIRRAPGLWFDRACIADAQWQKEPA
jgi:hypothetical protein